MSQGYDLVMFCFSMDNNTQLFKIQVSLGDCWENRPTVRSLFKIPHRDVI